MAIRPLVVCKMFEKLIELREDKDPLTQFMEVQTKLFKRGFVMVITAGNDSKMGCGKSYSAITVARNIDKHFTIDDVCFTARQFQDRIKHIEASGQINRVIVFDEAQTAIPASEYMSYINKAIFYILSTFRHLRIIVILVTPSLSWIDKRIRELITLWGRCSMYIEDGKRRVYMDVFLINTDFWGQDIYTKALYFSRPEKRKVIKVYRYAVENLPPEWAEAYETYAARLKTEIRANVEKLAKEYDDAMLGTTESAPIKIAKELYDNLIIRGEFEKERKISPITVNMLKENINREDARYISILLTRMLGAGYNVKPTTRA